MATKVVFKTTFEPARTIAPIYTGGEVSSNLGGGTIAACVEDDVVLVDIETGTVVCQIEGDGEPITSLCLSPQTSYLAVASRSLSLRIYHLTPGDQPLQINAEIQRTLQPHTTPVVSSAIDGTGSLLATGGADGTVKVWDLRAGFASHNFHGHAGVVSALSFFQIRSPAKEQGQLVKSRKRKARDEDEIDNEDVISAMRICLASGGEDGRVKIWDLQLRKTIANLDSHVSVIRSLVHSAGQKMLLSASRDRTMILWDTKTWKPYKIIPALEVLEAAGFLLDGRFCYGAGENGLLRVWNVESGKEVTSAQGSGLETDAVVSVVVMPSKDEVITLHQDQTMKIQSFAALATAGADEANVDLPVLRTLAGNHDEIIDMACVGSDRSTLALATNTERVRLISIQEQSAKSATSAALGSFGADIAILEGHEDIIICMDVDWSGHWLATGAKDNTARLWRLDPAGGLFQCIGSFAGHTESLGAIALPRSTPISGPAIQDPLNYPPAYLITGSQDKTIKLWDTSRLKCDSKITQPQTDVKTLYTRIAHEKDINALDVSPIAPLFASASQDRTIKIWSLEDGAVAGILRGHKRGVWSVRFSPANTPALNLSEGGTSGSKGLLVSGSGDRSVKIWSLATYTCLLTFEGHSNSVLKVMWLPPLPNTKPGEEDGFDRSASQPLNKQPMIASASSDTLVKLWSPYTSLDSDHLLTTLDNHSDRIWSLTSPHAYPNHSPSKTSTSTSPPSPYPYSFLSGAADATITFWRDTTIQTATAQSKRATERIEQDQLLQNHIHAKNYDEVITLALRLNHPGRLLIVFEDVVNLPDSERDIESQYTGVKAVDDVLANLTHRGIYLLLQRLRDWNTNIRTSTVAQKILNALLKIFPAETFLEIAKNQRKYRSTVIDSADQPGTVNSKAKSSEGVKELFRALEVYTDRHFKRMEELVDESYLIDFTLREMDEIAGSSGIGGGGSEKINGDVLESINGVEDVDMIEV